jgi:hypothetical protein
MKKSRALLSGIIASLACAGATLAGEIAGPPVFSPDANVGWIAHGNNFIPLPEGPRPVENESSRPYVTGIIPDPYVPEPPEFLAARLASEPPNGINRRIADLSNPILRPWARDEVSKFRDLVLSGKPAYSRQVSCWPIGVPGFLLYPVQPVFFIQGPREVVMVWQTDHQIRRIYLGREHSQNPKPSWFGDSVGHYEGDTLVVDTIGMNDKTYVDNYRTPHGPKLHVVERFRVVDGGKTLEVNVHVEDEDAFTTPWDAIQRYRRVEPGPLIEASCAENNINPFNQEVEPIPEAVRADF